MKGVAQIFWYYLTWQRTMALVAGAGVVMMLVAVLLSLFVSERLGEPLIVPSIFFVFMFPLTAAPLAFRELIANRRMSLLPGFPVRAGLALLLLIGSFSVSVGLVLMDEVSFPLTAPVTLFAWASIYAGLIQLFLTFRFMSSVLPVFGLAWLYVLGAELSLEPVARFWLDQRTQLASLGLGIPGWIPAFLILARKHRFRPIAKRRDELGQQILGPVGWTIQRRGGLVRQVAHSFLLGYPDALASRLLVMLWRIVVLPAMTGLLFCFLYFDAGESWDPAQGLAFALLTALVAVAATAVGYAETAARCRQLWLRCGGDRISQWRTLETCLLPELALLAAVVTVVTAAVYGLDLLPGFVLLHYVLLLIGTALFYTYLGLVIRITHHFSVAILALLTFSFILLLAGIGVSAATDSSVLIGGIEAGLLAMALLLRRVAMRGFGRIDWHRVRSRSMPARFSAA